MSTQMDSIEALQSLNAAQELAQAIGEAATAQNALTSKDAATAHKDFISLLDSKENGKHVGAVNGQQAAKGKTGSRELDASKPVKQFGSPLVVMDSAASINWATPASTLLFAAQQLR